MTNEQALRAAANFVQQQRKRELLTVAGFVSLVVGIGGGFGIWYALLGGGGIVFALGLYGLNRK